MSEILLLNLMRVAHDVTRAERAFAGDHQLTVLGTLHLGLEEIAAAYLKTIRRSMDMNEPIITDNYTITIDPSEAPKTNQSFPQLRAIVVIPVKDQGAICLDQSLRRGIITKEKVDKLSQLALQVAQSQQSEITEAQLLTQYNTLA